MKDIITDNSNSEMKPKVIIFHDWDYKNYTKFGYYNIWHSSTDFINALSKYFEVTIVTFPGFCGVREPNRPWRLADYAKFVNQKVMKGGFEMVIGYGFGACAVARWKNVFNSGIAITLIAPLTIPNPIEKPLLLRKLEFLEKWSRSLYNSIENWYTKKVSNNKNLAEGSAFLRQSYQLIMEDNITNDIKSAPVTQIILLFGEQDRIAQPTSLQVGLSGVMHEERIFVIPNAGHDIVNSHPDKLAKRIRAFYNHKK